jgi:NADPH:quinone reductase-like Zn-dependent oxidoreductase
MVEVKKGKMKAVRWEGKAFSISAKDVDTPKIVDPLDAIVRLTSAAICGSDLHTYRGRLPMNHPLTFGHENLGIVEEVGEHVTTLKKGDRVLVGAGIAEVKIMENWAKDFPENQHLMELVIISQEHLSWMEDRPSLCVCPLQMPIFLFCHQEMNTSLIISF